MRKVGYLSSGRFTKLDEEREKIKISTIFVINQDNFIIKCNDIRLYVYNCIKCLTTYGQ